MRKSQRVLLKILLHSWLFTTVNSLVCYSCTASLSPAIDESAQIAMRIFLESTYYLPSVHRYCSLENDIEFKTVPTSQCSHSDRCVKISAEGKGLHFVIRGCESQIYKPNVGVHEVGCRSNESPSLCYCSDNLCNHGTTKWTTRKLLITSILPLACFLNFL
ncbi:hypothetical protein M3Y94_01126300 [Aphelenchoides besseyi]|nr:hypothetical protein M3Y94_01126300 [Aphelenchoides besseyi]KAI6218325.1 hypothetical protein M3Y95_01178000 [Aphelenchoides besseyi]